MMTMTMDPSHPSSTTEVDEADEDDGDEDDGDDDDDEDDDEDNGDGDGERYHTISTIHQKRYCAYLTNQVFPWHNTIFEHQFSSV